MPTKPEHPAVTKINGCHFIDWRGKKKMNQAVAALQNWSTRLQMAKEAEMT